MAPSKKALAARSTLPSYRARRSNKAASVGTCPMIERSNVAAPSLTPMSGAASVAGDWRSGGCGGGRAWYWGAAARDVCWVMLRSPKAASAASIARSSEIPEPGAMAGWTPRGGAPLLGNTSPPLPRGFDELRWAPDEYGAEKESSRWSSSSKELKRFARTRLMRPMSQEGWQRPFSETRRSQSCCLFWLDFGLILG